MNINRSGRNLIITHNTWITIIHLCNDITGKFNYVVRKRNKKIPLNYFGFKKYKKTKKYILQDSYQIDTRTHYLIWFPYFFIRYANNDKREILIHEEQLTKIRTAKD